MGVVIRGRTLRPVFVNGVEVVRAQELPEGFSPTTQVLYAMHHGQEPGKVTFHRFRRWKWADTTPTQKEQTPADLEKVKPSLDDDLKDPRDQHVRRQPPGEHRSARTSSTASATACSRARGLPSSYSPPRRRSRVCWGWHYPEDRVVKDFACRLRGKIRSDDPAYFALVMEGKKGAAFVVRLWNTGRITLGRTGRHSSQFVLPKLKTEGHEKPAEGGKDNELLVVVRAGVMRLYVNGKQAADPVTLPEGMEAPSVGTFLCQDGKSEGRITLTRFTLWRLDAKGKDQEQTELAKEWPAELAKAMKGKPDIEDDFSDQKKKHFDPVRREGKPLESKKMSVEGVYAKKLEVHPRRQHEPDPLRLADPDGAAAGAHVCRVAAQAASRNIAWGVLVVSEGSPV